MATAGDMNKVNSILTKKNINEFFEMKNKVIYKLQNSKYDFHPVESEISEIKVEKAVYKNTERIKMEKKFCENFDILEKKISLLSKKEDKRLIEC